MLVQLQVAPSGQEVLTLSINFTPSLALYVWQIFQKGVWRAVQDLEARRQLWQLEAANSCTHGLIAAGMADECFLSTLLAAGPLYTLPADRQLYNSSTHFSSRTPVILLQVESSIKVILLVAQLLATVPAEDKSCLAQTHALVTSTFDPEQDRDIGAVIDDALQQLQVCDSPVLPDTEVLQAG